jgi:tyrosine aminotransferase
MIVAARHKVPIIADEIYAGMVFEGSTFTSLTDVGGEVPVLCCGGLAKRYLAPGWRVGWICVHDRNDVFAKGKVQHALVNLSQLILGACAPVQAAIPAIIENTPAAFYTDTMAKLKSAAELCFGKLDAIPGLKPVMPTGAMCVSLHPSHPSFPI